MLLLGSEERMNTTPDGLETTFRAIGIQDTVILKHVLVTSVTLLVYFEYLPLLCDYVDGRLALLHSGSELQYTTIWKLSYASGIQDTTHQSYTFSKCLQAHTVSQRCICPGSTNNLF